MVWNPYQRRLAGDPEIAQEMEREVEGRVEEAEREHEALSALPHRRWWQWRLRRRDRRG